jgi:hypothetical protein
VNPDPHTPGAEPEPPDGAEPGPGLAGRLLGKLLQPAREASARAAADTATAARWLWARRPTARRAAAIAFVTAVALLGANGVLFQAGLGTRLPAPLDWEALGALLERDARPGDAVALSPAWAERARLVAPAQVPVFAWPSFADEDLVGVRRVWLVALPRAPGFAWTPELELLQRAARSDATLPLGGLDVTRFDVAAPEIPLAFLPDRLGQAEVRLGEVICTPEENGFRCPGPSAVRVARALREVGGIPRPCLLAPPDHEAGVPLTIAFRGVPVGRVLRGHAGVAGDPPGSGGAPVRISVQVDGEEAGAAEIAGPGWRSFQLDTTRFAGRSRAVSLVLTAAGAAGPLCLDAVTLQ